MYTEQHLVPLIVACIPEYRDRLVQTVDCWLNEDGAVSIYGQLSALVQLLVERCDSGNYDGSDELFLLIEQLLADGNEAVQNAVATGFLESMQNQTQLSGEHWAPLIGERARAHCVAMDGFYGVKTPGLYDVDIDP